MTLLQLQQKMLDRLGIKRRQEMLVDAVAASIARDEQQKARDRRRASFNKVLGFIGVMGFIAMASAGIGQVSDAAGRVIMNARLYDGTNYYDAAKTGQLPTALVGGRLDVLSSFVWPNGPPGWIPISDGDSLRLKAWNDAGCQNVTPGGDLPPQVGDCEEYQGMVSIKFMRADANGRADGVVRKISKVMTVDKAIAAQGVASGGGASWPFGAAAGRGRTFTDADSPGTTCALSIVTTGELVTSCSHGYTVGSRITINITGNGANTTPTIDGLHSVQIISATTYRLLDVDVTSGCDDGGGTICPGSHYGSRILSSATAAFTTADAGKTVTCTTGGIVCTTADVPCQGPKFPIGTLYQGMLTTFISATQMGVLPTLHNDPGGTATCKIEPVLVDDSDGAEAGRGWWINGDVNYWNSEVISLAGNRAGIKEGQTFYEAEINRNPLSVGATHVMHDGFKLGSDYQETSYHIPLNGTVSRHKGDTLGWERQIVYGTSAGYQCSPVSPCPAAGADWTIAVPTNAQWQLASCRSTLTASSTQQTRIPALIIDDGGSNIELASVPLEVQMAGTTITYTWCRGCFPRVITLPAGNVQIIGDLPASLEMTEGARIRTVTTGIHASDQWSGTVCKIRQKIAE
jgi:hypothetical protein